MEKFHVMYFMEGKKIVIMKFTFCYNFITSGVRPAQSKYNDLTNFYCWAAVLKELDLK